MFFCVAFCLAMFSFLFCIVFFALFLFCCGAFWGGRGVCVAFRFVVFVLLSCLYIAGPVTIFTTSDCCDLYMMLIGILMFKNVIIFFISGNVIPVHSSKTRLIVQSSLFKF